MRTEFDAQESVPGEIKYTIDHGGAVYRFRSRNALRGVYKGFHK